MSADLEKAVTFVVGRIREEADRIGRPLDEEERGFLEDLPSAPTNPTLHNDPYSESAGPSLRDLPFERLVSLAKAARVRDLQVHPEAAREWELAAAVLQLNRHPMSWLLMWSGAKKLRPRWDRLLLVGTAVFLVFAGISGAIALSALMDRFGEAWRKPLFVLGGIAYCTIAVVVVVASHRREQSALRRFVEKSPPRSL